MQWYLHWITAMCISISLFSCSTKQTNYNSAKSISFAIYKGDKYNTKVYDCTYVQVHIIVDRVTKTQRIQVWDTTFNEKRLKQYPSLDKALSQTVVVPVSTKANEHFEVRCILIYQSKGSKLEMQDETRIDGNSAKLNIRI
jgi:hypothetical protein